MVLYHLQFTSPYEHFEKIGITKHNPFKRFSIGKYLEYDMKVLELFDLPEKECRQVEKAIHKKYKNISYVPKNKKFTGFTECFSPDLINLEEYREFTKKYKVDISNLIETNTPYYSDKNKIDVDCTYTLSEFKDLQQCEYYYPRTGKNYIAILKNEKLYAKELPDSGNFYKIKENKYEIHRDEAKRY